MALDCGGPPKAKVCCNCKKGKKPKKCKYIVPEIPRSYKPNQGPYKYGGGFACDTVYKLSYQGGECSECRQKSYKPDSVYVPSKSPMACETTFNLSYQGTMGERLMPSKRFNHDMMGKGPFQSMTTCRHDYTPKPYTFTPDFKPKQVIMESPPLECSTVMQLSYQPAEFSRTKSYKPDSQYQASTAPFACDTVQRLSYVPVSPYPLGPMPWKPNPKYIQPTSPFADDTCYKLSYMYPGMFICEPEPDCNECTCDPCPDIKAHDDI